MQIPDNQWSFLVYINATFAQQFDLYDADGNPVDQYEDAEWQAVVATPDGTTIWTSVPGDWTTISDYQRLLTIPQEITADFPPGNLVVDMNLIVSPTEQYRFVRRGPGQATQRLVPSV